ncbi:MAG: helix-turn-helix domain-containing protein [Verrucomicrobia bacterium]|nr:helix-turn-helix domain-containing protein [Verrucomicrobiota bacterium]
MPFSTSMLDEHSSGEAPQPYGAQLKALREAKGLSVQQVAEATRVPADKVEAIEAGGVLHDTPLAYARGFVRIYAEYLEADAEAILGAFDALRRPLKTKLYVRNVGPMSHKDYRPGRRRGAGRAVRTVLLVVVIAAILVGAAYVYVNLDRILGLRHDEPAPGDAPGDGLSHETPLPGDAGGTTLPPGRHYEIKIVAKENVVLQSVVQDGTVAKTDEVIAAGGSYTASGQERVEITMTDAALVQVYTDGTPITEDLGTGPVTISYDSEGFHFSHEGEE